MCQLQSFCILPHVWYYTGPRELASIYKRQIATPQKYGSTSKHWFSKTFIQHLYSQTKDNISSEGDHSNLNKISKTYTFKVRQSTDITHPRGSWFKQSLGKRNKGISGRPCIGFRGHFSITLSTSSSPSSLYVDGESSYFSDDSNDDDTLTTSMTELTFL